VLPFNIYTVAEASDFKFGIAKAHHKITARVKSGRGLGLGKQIWVIINVIDVNYTVFLNIHYL